MKEIQLSYLDLKTFTEQDAEDYCQINNINSENITELYLNDNELTDISGIKLFKNVEYLNIDNNKIEDISVLKDLINLKELVIRNNEIKDISVLKDLINLKELSLKNNPIKDISVIQYLKNLKILSINNLKLESDQVQYINSLNNLKQLLAEKGFKNKSSLNKLKDIIKIK